MHQHEKRAWGSVDEFRRERAARLERARAAAAARASRERAEKVDLGEHHPVVVSLAAYREQLATGEPRQLDYVGALVEWIRVGERLTPESLVIACEFMQGWPDEVRPGATVLPFRP